MRILLSLAVLLLAGCGPGGLFSNNEGGLVGAIGPGSGGPASPAARQHQAIQASNGALAEIYRFDVQLKAASDAARKQLVLQQEKVAQDALQAVFALVYDATRTSPPDFLLIFQVAKDALDSGRLKPSPEERIAYYRSALSKIGAMNG
ncbi:MAG: hypothetical protein JWM80_69 [Cyanobacteria bacterium RYN_339]|nr:hypothetical protein [Cyanobacteria bacterium RYN_339]